MNKLEHWQRGPVEGIPPLLQPVAHALLQARDEVQNAVKDFPETLLWQKPAGVASVAFHLQHIPGVIDRLFTYAKGEQLSLKQLSELAAEGKENADINLPGLLDHFSTQTDIALQHLRNTREGTLLEERRVGRKQIPSNIFGLLFHAAEHVQRHTGQLLVTVRVLLAE